MQQRIWRWPCLSMRADGAACCLAPCWIVSDGFLNEPASSQRCMEALSCHRHTHHLPAARGQHLLVMPGLRWRCEHVFQAHASIDARLETSHQLLTGGRYNLWSDACLGKTLKSRQLHFGNASQALSGNIININLKHQQSLHRPLEDHAS